MAGAGQVSVRGLSQLRLLLRQTLVTKGSEIRQTWCWALYVRSPSRALKHPTKRRPAVLSLSLLVLQPAVGAAGAGVGGSGDPPEAPRQVSRHSGWEPQSAAGFPERLWSPLCRKLNVVTGHLLWRAPRCRPPFCRSSFPVRVPLGQGETGPVSSLQRKYDFVSLTNPGWDSAWFGYSRHWCPEVISALFHHFKCLVPYYYPVNYPKT